MLVNIMWCSGSDYTSVHKVHEQLLIAAGYEGGYEDWVLQGDPCRGFRAWNVPRRVLKGRGFRKLAQWCWRRRILQELQAVDARVLLIDGLGAARFVLPLLKQSKKLKAVVLFHGEVRIRSTDNAMFSGVPADSLRLAAVSQTLATVIAEGSRLPVAVLRSALDPEQVVQRLRSRSAARSRLGLPCDAVVFGALGRLVTEKGFDVLIEAFAKIACEQPRLQLVILGEGEQRSLLEQRIVSLGLSGRVHLPGYLEDAATLYCAFDWIFLPSHREGLGLVLQEAVIAKVPVVASNLVVFREQLGNSATYVEPGSIGGWQEAIELCLLQSPEQVAKRQGQVLAAQRRWEEYQHAARELLWRQ